jgi:hypothetical protein
MTPRELYFATHHQAAQVVAALMLGCRVDELTVAGSPQDFVWNLDAVPFEDVQAICAAGFEMEIVLGRLQEHAWTRSQLDRVLMAEVYTGRTGNVALQTLTDEQFNQGAVSSRAILDHQTARKAIDLLADALNDVYGSKERKITGVDIRTITGLEPAVAAVPVASNEV